MGPATSRGRTDLKNFGPAGSETGCSWFGDGCEGLRVQVAAEDAGWDGGIWPRQLVVSLRRRPGRGEGRGADPTRKSGHPSSSSVEPGPSPHPRRLASPATPFRHPRAWPPHPAGRPHDAVRWPSRAASRPHPEREVRPRTSSCRVATPQIPPPCRASALSNRAALQIRVALWISLLHTPSPAATPRAVARHSTSTLPHRCPVASPCPAAAPHRCRSEGRTEGRGGAPGMGFGEERTGEREGIGPG
uniref:Uncharacterized protein n=1 Tax=Setaria viridis TaxID=4556 RepID=A0A4U6W332_SETVI|nr:hypothetical protein SEVIR_1G003700v2 [Setaria viridis]